MPVPPGSLLDAALRYAELGYQVFPCAPGSKRPLNQNGFLDATGDAEQIERWWSARRGTVTIADIDLRVGGKWRWVLMTDRGFEVAFRGVYHEIVPNERIVCTEVYEGFPDGEALITYTFTEKDGRTMLSLLVQHEKPEHRDAHINSGMESGMQDAMDLLEEVGWRFRFIRVPSANLDGYFVTSYKTPSGNFGLRGFSVCFGSQESPFHRGLTVVTRRACMMPIVWPIPCASRTRAMR